MRFSGGWLVELEGSAIFNALDDGRMERVKGRGRTKVVGEWGFLCVWQGKKKNRPQPSLRETRGGDKSNANRTHPDRGADTPLFRFKSHPSKPPIFPFFDTSLEGASPYREKEANRPSETQALMQTRPRASQKSPRNRDRGVSAPRSGQTRTGQTSIAVRTPPISLSLPKR